MALDTTKLLTQIKIKASLPDGRYTDAEILDIANDVLQSQVVPLIINLKEEYYVTSASQNITANVSSYPIPYRAYGLMLREAKKVQSNSLINLIRVDPTAITTTVAGNPTSFYLEGHDVVLYPIPSTTQATLKLSYFITPSKPVQSTEVAVITAINTATGIITATPPSTWTTASTYDFVSRRNGHKCLAIDLTPTAISSTTITFNASDLPSSLAVGDYVALAQEAPFVQIPDAGFPLVVQLVANELLEDLGDQEALQIGISKAENLKQTFTQAMSVRVSGEPKRSKIKL